MNRFRWRWAQASASACVLALAALALCQPLGVLRAQEAAVATPAPGRFMDPAVVDLAKALPAPPEADSLAAQADLEAVLQAQAWRTPDQVAWAKQIDADGDFDSAAVLGPWFNAEKLPVCARFLKDVAKDVKRVSARAKDVYHRPRPFRVSPDVKPCVFEPPVFSYSYPSGHSTRAFARALVLAEVFPERRAELLAFAHKAAWGRILGGVHFPSDDVGGRLLAEATVTAMLKSPAFQKAVAECRQEIEAVRAASH